MRIRIYIWIGVLFVCITSCEDVPCTKDMRNPALGLGFFESDELYSANKKINVDIEYINVYNQILTDTFEFINEILLPVLPDSGFLNINIAYNRIMFIENDTFPVTDTLPVDTTLIPGLDTIDFSWDTIPYVIDTIGNKLVPDTSYLNNIFQNIHLIYSSELIPISPECGFGFEYRIDSIDYSGNYIDTIILNKNILAPVSIYEKQPVHINIFF